MAIIFTTDRRALADKLGDIIDLAEGYRADVRRPGYVTQRHANVEVHPNGTTYAFVFDDTIWKHRLVILDYLDKFGISRAAIANKVQRIRDAISTNESFTFTSGLLSGVTLTLAEKGSDWTPEQLMAQGQGK